MTGLPAATRLHAISSCLQQYTALFTSVGRWRCKTSSHRRQAPLLDVCFNEHKPHLAKVDMDSAWSIRPNSRKEVLGFQSMSNVVQLFPIPREEYCPCSWSVSHTNYITLDVLRSIACRNEWLVKPSMAGGDVSHRRLVESWRVSEQARNQPRK